MTQGYIYVLANSSMPNMIKVGKTTRQPSLRAQELSSVTGVPTPFLVVYEKQFNDCNSAESFIHELLSIKGFRVSANREFFNAPVHDVIEAVLQAVSYDIQDSDDEDDSEYFDSSVSDVDLEDLFLEQDVTKPVWFDIWEEAQSYYYGYEDTLQDYDEAIRLYKQSIKLGCILAYHQIGFMYECGDGVTESPKKAFEWHKEGAKNKNYICYIAMARLVLSQGNESNAKKSLQLFCKVRDENFSEHLETELGMLFKIVVFLSWLESFTSTGFSIPNEFVMFLSSNRDDIIKEIDSFVESNDGYIVVRSWFNELMS